MENYLFIYLRLYLPFTAPAISFVQVLASVWNRFFFCVENLNALVTHTCSVGGYRDWDFFWSLFIHIVSLPFFLHLVCVRVATYFPVRLLESPLPNPLWPTDAFFS